MLFAALFSACAADDAHDALDAQVAVPDGDAPTDDEMLDAGMIDPPATGLLPEHDAGGAVSDAGAGDAASDGALPEGARLHDRRTFTIDTATLPFGPLPGSTTVETDRWFGVIGNAGYRIEVPKSWNGMLVVYAHGYVGTGPGLSVRTPTIRRHLVEQGYAWAASSFATNYYDARAGVEDSNALALAFRRIAQQNGRTLAEPTRRYIVGHALGGHVAAAAVERETAQRARHQVRYDGALSMCGALGGSALADYFAAYETAVHALAKRPITSWPVSDLMVARPLLTSALFTRFPSQTTPAGDQLRALVLALTGGARPLFAQGFAGPSHQQLWSSVLSGDGPFHGITRGEVADTRTLRFQLDGDLAPSSDEQALNASVYRVTPDPLANAPRTDGVRWIPPLEADFDVPVVALHTLGDLFIPFHMQQIYRKKAIEKGSEGRLVQRAIRGIGHCDFTLAEQVAAFRALVDWVERGAVPEGDDVLDVATVAGPYYGCRFTDDRLSADDASDVRTTRTAGSGCPVTQ